jgi:maleylpyruvate isomerase
MTAPLADLAAVDAATDRLLADVARLDPAALAAPCLLPGWTRGHLLAHLAHNADALARVLTGRPMYPSEAARDAAVERDAARPPAEHLAALRDSAARLAATAAGLTAERWRATVTFRNGATGPAAVVPLRRLTEIELHGVDLDTGRTLADLSPAFLDRGPGYLAARLDGHPGVPPLELRTEDGRAWRTGREPRDGEQPLAVAGTPAALIGWLSGRTTGAGLTSRAPLPALPPL